MSDSDELRERVARVLDEHLRGAWRSGTVTDRVLAALGLDDLDAAVERAGEALRVEQGTRLDFARAALEAALTPPEAET